MNLTEEEEEEKKKKKINKTKEELNLTWGQGEVRVRGEE